METITIDTHGNKDIEREAEEGGLRPHDLPTITAIGDLVLATAPAGPLQVGEWALTLSDYALSGEPIPGTLLEPSYQIHAKKGDLEYIYQVKERRTVTVAAPMTPEQLAEHTGA